MTAPTVDVPVLVYDGDCGFCSASARFGQRWIGRMPTVASYQALEASGALGRLGLTPERCSLAVQYVARDRAVYSAHDAVAALLLGAGRGWWVLGALLRAPGIHALAGVAYRCVARNRHRLPGATDRCSLSSTSRPSSAP
jgi:predicted DCC family thiol-disulfide oxidoreductase YuxK